MKRNVGKREALSKALLVAIGHDQVSGHTEQGLIVLTNALRNLGIIHSSNMSRCDYPDSNCLHR